MKRPLVEVRRAIGAAGGEGQERIGAGVRFAGAALVTSLHSSSTSFRDPEFDAAVARAMATVPRDAFVPERLKAHADLDEPLPIGEGQTISQPSLVAWMTRALRVGPGDRVLEVGTGSGFQTAVLAALGCDVYSIELRPSLANRARVHLDELGYTDVKTRVGDGALGWPEAAPFDGILVTAAAEAIPPALLEELAVGARLIMPVGPADRAQVLAIVERTPDGFSRQDGPMVRFVPLRSAEDAG